MATLTGKTAAEVGFAPGRPGHSLTETQINQYNVYWVCDCGAQFYTRYKRDGQIGKATSRYWRQHLDSLDLPDDEIIPVGVVRKPRVEWQIYVFSRSYAGAEDFVKGTRYKGWLLGAAGNHAQWYNMQHYAVGVRRVSSKGNHLGYSLHTLARTKQDAVAKARLLMQREADDGHKVNDMMDDALPVALNPESSFASLLSRIDETVETGNLPEVEAVLAEVTQVLSLTPVLEQRVIDLEARKTEVVKGMLNQHSTSQLSVGQNSDANV
jgi:hypothetical protein